MSGISSFVHMCSIYTYVTILTDSKSSICTIKCLLLERAAPDANKELNPDVTPINLDAFQFHGSMQRGGDEADTSCWTSPSGTGFMIRGKTYLKDSIKVCLCDIDIDALCNDR